jgi:hypothetical protein
VITPAVSRDFFRVGVSYRVMGDRCSLDGGCS